LIGAEAILGSDSPTENLLLGEPFDVLDVINYNDIAISELFSIIRD